jgi:hypothetical protein
MQKITIEQYLDQKKKTFEQIIKEFESKHMTIDDLRKVFLDQSRQLQLDGTKFNTMFIEIELLFDAVPDTKFKALFTNNFIELSKLEGSGFKSWSDGIEFNEKIKDHLKVSFRCGMHDLEIMQLICNTLNEYPPDKKQVILLFIQRYQNINEIYFIKTLQIILYALMLTAPSRILEMKYLYKNGNETQIRVKSYREISKLRLAKKLALLENMPPYYEFSKIAKLCTKDVRKAFGEQSFNLENARELSEYRLILLECFYYYSMKCYLKSKGLL